MAGRVIDVQQDRVEPFVRNPRIDTLEFTRAKKSPARNSQRESALSPAPMGTNPRRCQSITTGNASTTNNERTAEFSSAACAV